MHQFWLRSDHGSLVRIHLLLRSHAGRLLLLLSHLHRCRLLRLLCICCLLLLLSRSGLGPLLLLGSSSCRLVHWLGALPSCCLACLSCGCRHCLLRCCSSIASCGCPARPASRCSPWRQRLARAQPPHAAVGMAAVEGWEQLGRQRRQEGAERRLLVLRGTPLHIARVLRLVGSAAPTACGKGQAARRSLGLAKQGKIPAAFFLLRRHTILYPAHLLHT